MIRSQEKISCYSHLAGVFAASGGTIYLIHMVRAWTAHMVVAIVYGLSAILLFSASASYHGLKQNEDEISIWRKLDHSAIFFMIAGTYTPVCYIYLSGYWKWSIIMIQWALVAGGIFLKFFYLHAPHGLILPVCRRHILYGRGDILCDQKTGLEGGVWFSRNLSPLRPPGRGIPLSVGLHRPGGMTELLRFIDLDGSRSSLEVYSENDDQPRNQDCNRRNPASMET